MFIFDDILLSPAKGLFWVFKEIHKAAQKELAGEADRLTQELSALYRKLEAGELSESAFDELEKKILDRLDELSAMQQEDQDDDEAGSDDDEADSDAEASAEDSDDDDDDDDDEEEDEDAEDDDDGSSVTLGLEGLIAQAQAEEREEAEGDDDPTAGGER
ncbi:MAG: gas vesicle protein GvpG [Planctomycetota bacterium]|nr:gas vesicle protein GvpG [Planctomycetota bacterium]